MSKPVRADSSPEATEHTNTPIRILIVEDSAVQSLLLRHVLETQAGLEVVGTACNGQEALRLTAELEPDLITMDVQMPVMDGLEATRAIMERYPRPILVVAALSSKQSVAAQEMLGAGALDVFPKPTNLDEWYAVAELLGERVRVLAHASLLSETKLQSYSSAARRTALANRGRPHVIALAASTGGPLALQRILRRLPANYCVPIVVVQHIAPGFGAGLARWLGSTCALPVRLAVERADVECRGVTVAPDDQHLLVTYEKKFQFGADLSVGSLRPRADLLFSSLARVYGALAVGIVLTGMGDDGAQGLSELHRAGALTIAQDESTSVVYGMPKAAFEAGATTLMLSLNDIATLVRQLGVKSPHTTDTRGSYPSSESRP